MSATQRRFGAGASNTAPAGQTAAPRASSGTVVRGRFRPFRTPDRSRSRISRSTVHRAIATPWVFSSSHTFRASYTSFPAVFYTPP
jgi:hypothetical protein